MRSLRTAESAPRRTPGRRRRRTRAPARALALQIAGARRSGRRGRARLRRPRTRAWSRRRFRRGRRGFAAPSPRASSASATTRAAAATASAHVGALSSRTSWSPSAPANVTRASAPASSSTTSTVSAGEAQASRGLQVACDCMPERPRRTARARRVRNARALDGSVGRLCRQRHAGDRAADADHGRARSARHPEKVLAERSFQGFSAASEPLPERQQVVRYRRRNTPDVARGIGQGHRDCVQRDAPQFDHRALRPPARCGEDHRKRDRRAARTGPEACTERRIRPVSG